LYLTFLTLFPVLLHGSAHASDAEVERAEVESSSGDPEFVPLSKALQAHIAEEVHRRVEDVLKHTVVEAMEHHTSGGKDEGQITILGFRSNASKGFEINPDIGFVTTYYDRGSVATSNTFAPAIQPSIAISFGFGGYASIQSSHVLSARQLEKSADEIGATFGYNNHTQWLDFDAGFTTTLNPVTSQVASTNEAYIYVGTGDFLPHLTPKLNSTFVIGGRDGEGNPVPLGWYGQLRLDLHYEFGGPHAILTGITGSGQVMGEPGFQWVDTTLEGFYLHQLENGLYVAPGFTAAYSFVEERFIGLGTLNFGLTL
jgi:hypothetical protein